MKIKILTICLLLFTSQVFAKDFEYELVGELLGSYDPWWGFGLVTKTRVIFVRHKKREKRIYPEEMISNFWQKKGNPTGICTVKADTEFLYSDGVGFPYIDDNGKRGFFSPHKIWFRCIKNEN